MDALAEDLRISQTDSWCVCEMRSERHQGGLRSHVFKGSMKEWSGRIVLPKILLLGQVQGFDGASPDLI